MRERVLLKKPINTMVEGAGHITTWEAGLSEWAKVEPVKSLYHLQDSQFILQNALKFTMRYFSFFDPSWLITYRGRDYTVNSIRDIQQRDRFMEIIAVMNDDLPVPITT